MDNDNPYANFGQEPEPPAPAQPAVESTDRSWLVLLHLSVFLGYLVPLAGFIAPVVIWMIMKDDSPEMDRHGRNVINWSICSTIYVIASVLLCFVLIGIPLIIIMGVLVVVFPIVGAVKASQGVEWRYPLTIHFF